MATEVCSSVYILPRAAMAIRKLKRKNPEEHSALYANSLIAIR
jgi:hypothetical protein